ncbi:phage major capsid protein, HK97 family [Actinobacteria bacterium OV450]|nr:phage major capsid protein, HK97 family [Actinobacteria bacterium OV450]
MPKTDDVNFEFPALRDARAKYGAAQKRLAEVFQEAGSEMDFTKVKCISGSVAEKIAEVRKMNDELPDLKKSVDDYMALARAAATAKESGSVESGDGARGGTKQRKPFDLGEDVFQAAIKAAGYRPGQGIGAVKHIDVELKTLFERGAGWDPEDTRTGHLELTALRPAPHVVDFIPQTTTSQSTVVYMEETTFTNNAAEVTEGSTFGEAALALTERTSEVRKIAVWLPFTDEQVEDEPRARDYINNRLRYMLANRLDLQVLTGNGTAPNLKGTENVSSINTQALGTDSVPDAIYKGMRQIRDTGFAEPNVVFIRPSKWEGVRLLKTADGQYIWGHPSIPGIETIWGVRVVQTTVPTATKAIIGDYANYAELAVRRGVDVQMTNSHSSDFINGKQAIRMDLRAALLHYRPTAFTVVTGL